MKFRLGARGIYSYCQKTRTGLQQFMAGSRNFNLSTISRKDVMCLGGVLQCFLLPILYIYIFVLGRYPDGVQYP